MKTMQGYVIGVYNPNFSGLANVQIAERENAYETRDPGTITVARIEAGFGVRQLVNYFGGMERLKRVAPTTKMEFEIDDLGLIASFKPVQEA